MPQKRHRELGSANHRFCSPPCKPSMVSIDEVTGNTDSKNQSVKRASTARRGSSSFLPTCISCHVMLCYVHTCHRAGSDGIDILEYPDIPLPHVSPCTHAMDTCILGHTMATSSFLQGVCIGNINPTLRRKCLCYYRSNSRTSTMQHSIIERSLKVSTMKQG